MLRHKVLPLTLRTIGLDCNFFLFFSHTYFEFQAHKNFRVKTANVQTQTQVRATFQSFYLFIRLLVVASFFSFFIFLTSTFPTPSLFFFLHSSSAGLFFFLHTCPTLASLPLLSAHSHTCSSLLH